MLNISNHRLNKHVDLEVYKSIRLMKRRTYYNSINKFLKIFSIIAFIILFLPWTQNITSEGIVTTLLPSGRPQTLQSPIPGRIEAWLVQEGDFIKKGDTLIKISEIKSDYFDLDLLDRTLEQIDGNKNASMAYADKAASLKRQIEGL